MKVDFEKYGGMVPVVVQDFLDDTVLMVGFMNSEALKVTVETGRVTFFSRTRQRLWTKGETSGNFLEVKEIKADCDNDTILIKAIPAGVVCHLGTDTCFGDKGAKGFLYILEEVIRRRVEAADQASYTFRLFSEGMNRMAQKVGEEAVELILEAGGTNDERFRDEAADLLYHFLVLLRAREMSLEQVEEVLKERHAVKNK